MAFKGPLSRTLALAAAAMLLSVAANAQYFNFRTTWVPDPIPASLGGSIDITNQTATQPYPGFNGGSKSNFAGAAGTDIVLGNFFAVSSAPDQSPGPETVNQNYTITVELQLADSAGNPLSGFIAHDFTGNFSGTISTNSSNITNTNLNVFPKVYDFGGGNVFTVFRTAFQPPNAPGSPNPGSLGAHVTGPLAVPEPGALSLLFGSGIGGSLFFFRRLRRR